MLSLSNNYIRGPHTFASFGFGRILADHVILGRSVRDLNNDSVRKFTDTYTIIDDSSMDNFKILKSPVSTESKSAPVAMEVSPSESITVSFRNELNKKNDKNDKPVIEISHQDCTKDHLHIDASPRHGKVVGDTWFGGVSFSACERYVAYVACTETEGQDKSFFDTDSTSEGDKGKKFEFVSDWGEKYVGVGATSINIVDTYTGKIITVPEDEDATVGQPTFSTLEGSYKLAYTKWSTSHKNNKLGMIYCYQRPCSIYEIDISALLLSLETEEETQVAKGLCLTTGLANARSPRYCPDGSKIAFIGREQSLSSHNGCFQLFTIPSATGNTVGTAELVLDINATFKSDLCTTEGITTFPGLFADQLPKRCWLDTDTLVLNTQWGSRDSGCLVTLTTKSILRLTPILAPLVVSRGTVNMEWNRGEDVTCSVLDVDARTGRLLYQTSSPCRPAQVTLCDFKMECDGYVSRITPFPEQSCTQIHYHSNNYKEKKDIKKEGTEDTDGGVTVIPTLATPLSTIDLKQQLNYMSWKINTHQPSEHNASIRNTPLDVPFESILILPPFALETIEDNNRNFEKIPLIVVPHGGPHSCMPTAFVPSYAFLAIQLNAAILHVNYRGSTGFGQNGIDALLGNIGSVDVQDMHQAITDITTKYSNIVNINQLCIVGGSHGGFLTGHMIGQYPSMFKAACMRNPVTNIPSMVGVTDIPDWCHIECKGSEGYGRGFEKGAQATSAADLTQMFEMSPVHYIDHVTTPTMICLGLKDRRVPASQGIEYFKLLTAKGIKSKLLQFPEDVHAIDKPCSEAEHFVAMCSWFREHVK